MKSNKRKFIINILFTGLLTLIFVFLFYNAVESHVLNGKAGLYIGAFSFLALIIQFVWSVMELIKSVISRKVLWSFGWLSYTILLFLIARMASFILGIYLGFGTYTDG